MSTGRTRASTELQPCRSFNDDHINFLSTSWRWNPKATVTNEVRFGFNFAPAYFLTTQNFSSGTLIDSLNTPGFLPFTNPNPNFLPQGRNTHTWVWQDNATWIHGNHLFKFGGQFQRVAILVTNSAGIYPTLQLGFAPNNSLRSESFKLPGPAGTQASSADFDNGSALLSSVAGVLSNVSQTFNVTSQTSGYVNRAPQNNNFSQNDFALYIADNWRATRKLTVNFGVRWEDFIPVNEKHGLTLLPVIPLGQTPAQVLLSDATIDFAGGPSKRGLVQLVPRRFLAEHWSGVGSIRRRQNGGSRGLQHELCERCVLYGSAERGDGKRRIGDNGHRGPSRLERADSQQSGWRSRAEFPDSDDVFAECGVVGNCQ